MLFFRFIVAVVCVAVASGFRATMKLELPKFKNIATAAIAGIFAVNSFNLPAQALTKAEIDNLSYLQVKGTGLANRCPEVAKGSKTTIDIASGKKYKFTNLCIEPTNFQVEEEILVKRGETVKEFVNTKLMTRQTYTLEGISGDVDVKDGKVVFSEKDGIDYAATTVQLPGGERVPFLFSVKNLVAKGSTAGPITPGFEFGGSFTVPSYRTGGFLDPKGRGITTGYDFAQALPGLQADTAKVSDDEFYKENDKKFDVFPGDIEFAVKSVNGDENEFGGVYVSTQPSDTDLGGKVPKKILTKGIFYGQIEAL